MEKKTSRPLFSITAYDSKYSLCGLLCLLLSYDEVVSGVGPGLAGRAQLVNGGECFYLSGDIWGVFVVTQFPQHF